MASPASPVTVTTPPVAVASAAVAPFATPVPSTSVGAEGARVSMPWLSRPDRFAATAALPAVSIAPPATRLSATLPDATPAVGFTTTV